MRTCPRCEQTLELSEFNFKNRKTGRLQVHCKRCSRELIRDHYRRNVGYYIAKAKARNGPERRAAQERILAYLLAHPCVDCGEADPRVLDFDHVESSSKFRDIAHMLRSRNAWSRIEAEIAKCVVRCANCHRRRTAEQFNWWRATLSSDKRP